MFGAAPQQAAAAGAAATFEPEEELEAAEAAAAAARPAAPAAPEPSARKQQGPTSEQVTAIKAAIAAASTLEEVRRLEEALKTGHLPSQVSIGDGGAAANGAAAMDEG